MCKKTLALYILDLLSDVRTKIFYQESRDGNRKM